MASEQVVPRKSQDVERAVAAVEENLLSVPAPPVVPAHPAEVENVQHAPQEEDVVVIEAAEANSTDPQPSTSTASNASQDKDNDKENVVSEEVRRSRKRRHSASKRPFTNIYKAARLVTGANYASGLYDVDLAYELYERKFDTTSEEFAEATENLHKREKENEHLREKYLVAKNKNIQGDRDFEEQSKLVQRINRSFFQIEIVNNYRNTLMRTIGNLLNSMHDYSKAAKIMKEN